MTFYERIDAEHDRLLNKQFALKNRNKATLTSLLAFILRSPFCTGIHHADDALIAHESFLAVHPDAQKSPVIVSSLHVG